MFCYPPGVYIQITLYLFPLLVLSLCYNHAIHYSRYFYLAIISSSVHYYLAQAYLPRKVSLIISAVLCTMATLHYRMFFFAYGFVLSQAYNSDLIISQPYQISHYVFITHVFGLFISSCVVLPIYLQVVLAISSIAISFKAIPPPIESKDPYQAMKSMIIGTDRNEMVALDVAIGMSSHTNNKAVLLSRDKDSELRINSSEYTFLCREFKTYVKGIHKHQQLELGLFYTLFLLSQGSSLFFFLSLLNLFPLRYFTIFIILAAASSLQLWNQEIAVYLTVLADFGSSHNVPFKLLSGYLLYLLLVLARL